MMGPVISTIFYNAFAIGVWAYLSVLFDKWWIALFAVLFLQGIRISNNDDKDDGGDGGDSE